MSRQREKTTASSSVPKLNWPTMSTRKTRSAKSTPSDMRIKFYQPKPKKPVTLGDAVESPLAQLHRETEAINDDEDEEEGEEEEEEVEDVINVDQGAAEEDEDMGEEEEEEDYEDHDADADADVDAEMAEAGDEDNAENTGGSGEAGEGGEQATGNNTAGNNVYNFPTHLYPDRKSCLAAANEVAQAHGFALSTHKSSQKRAVVICSRGGMPNARGPEEVVLRRTKSLKCDCPFRIAIRSKVTYSQNPETGEKIKGVGHYISVENPNHNHPLLEGAELAAIPKMRRLTKEQMEFVRGLEREGKPPPQIYNMLKFKWPECLANSKDVRNAINKIHRESTATGDITTNNNHASGSDTAALQAFVNELTATSANDSPVAPTPTTNTNTNTPTVQRWRLGKRPLENGTPTAQPASRPRLVGGKNQISGPAFPTVESLPAPSELFRRRLPYILTIHGDLNPSKNSIKVTCSHEPTLELIAKYFKSHARVSKNNDTPVVKVEMIPSFLNAGQDGGVLYDGLVIKPTMAGAPLNPSTVVAFVEGVLKYTCIGVGSKELFWQFKRDIPAE